MNKKDLFTLCDTACTNFSGNVDQLMSAFGMLHICYFYGWRFLYISYSKKTIANSEKILSIKFRALFPEFGNYSFTSQGLTNALQYDNFWKCVSGDTKIKDRKILIHPLKACKAFHHGGTAYQLAENITEAQNFTK